MERVRNGIRGRLRAILEHLHLRAPPTLVNVSQLETAQAKALEYLLQWERPETLGDYLEFGVCHGTSMACMHRQLVDHALDHVRLFGFDSFCGLPEDDEEGFWRAGTFKADIRRTRRQLERAGVERDRTFLIEGWFSETLTAATAERHNLRKASVLMIDCDLYSAAREALDFSAPLLAEVGIVLFDDWFPLAAENKGEKRAFDEFLQAHPEFSSTLITTYDYKPGDQHGRVFALHRRPV